MSRTRRSILTYASNALFLIVTPAVAIVTTPLLIGWLGDARFGANRAMTDLYAYLALLEFGLSGALLPLLVRARARVAREDEGRILASGIRAYLRVVPIQLLA